MDKEQYSSFDDWFREAAAQPGPDFNDAAWQQMETRLDGERKKRRRIIFWWWFTGIMVGAGLFLFTLQYKFDGVPASVTTAPVGTAPAQQAGAANQAGNSPQSHGQIETLPDPYENSLAKVQSLHIVPADKALENHQQEIDLFDKAPGASSKFHIKGKVPGKKAGSHSVGDNYNSQVKKQTEDLSIQKKSTHSADAPIISESPENQAKVSNVHVSTENTTVSDSGGEAVKIVDSSTVVAEKNPVKDSADQIKSVAKSTKNKPEKKNHFYLYGAIAPEWSYIKRRGTEHAALSYGAGIGYAFSSKWAVQTGLFLTGKKYIAREGDYSPKPGSYYDNPNYVIESVDADCAVLEIPIAVRYTFLQKKATSFYGIVAINSAIMKKEDYTYDYMRNGNPAYSSHTYKTGIVHLFASASLTVGMERKINHKFSLLFAPYFNLPLRGIGEGRVHLNSFGFLGGIKYKLPF